MTPQHRPDGREQEDGMIEELIVRLADATGPDRELDCLAHLARYPDTLVMVVGGGWRGERPVQYQLASELVKGWRGDWEGFATQINALPYTASIDAALTLADSETDPLDILGEALASAREDRDGVVFLPLHIVIVAAKRLYLMGIEKGKGA